MLNATLHHYLQQFDSPIAVDMLTNLYVDNVISDCNSHDQAIQYYQKASSMMSDANFNLRVSLSLYYAFNFTYYSFQKFS